MSDERLRAHERRWQESRDPDDGARALIERLRAGAIHETGLRLAAFLEDKAAQRAAGQLGLDVSDEQDAEFGRWLVVVCNHGLEVAVRAAAVFARYEMARLRLRIPQPHRLVEALFRWTERPSLDAYARVKTLHEGTVSLYHRTPRILSAFDAAEPAFLGASFVIENEAHWPGSQLMASVVRPARELQNVVKEDLRAWALADRPVLPETSPLARRVLSGELGGQRVFLAAYLDHAGAREALSPGVAEARKASGGGPSEGLAFFTRWFAGLLDWGTTPLLRAFCSLGGLICSEHPASPAQEKALEDLVKLSEAPDSGPKMDAALGHLEDLVRSARRASKAAAPLARFFQHLLTLPWFLDPFQPGLAREMEEVGLVLSTWSGVMGVEVDGEPYLLVRGSDSDHVEAVEYEGHGGFSQQQALQRLILLLINAARGLGFSDELMRRTIVEDLIPWVLR